MDTTQPVTTPASLASRLGRPDAPIVVDVRRDAAFQEDPRRVAGALRRKPEGVAAWAGALPSGPIVVYCVHGHEVSQEACRALRALGRDATILEGGHAAWLAAGRPTIRPAPFPALDERSTLWVTRERPKIDRVACPWLIRRFIDPLAAIRYVPAADVLDEAERCGGVPFDVPEVAFSHVGERCSFDAFLERFDLHAPGLGVLATIVRGADTGRLDLAPEAPGLLAVALGMAALFEDDQALLAHGLTVYDALYAWCRGARDEKHDWRPETMPTSRARA
jgi:rhodanese-related sulfurtransferase